MPLTPPFGTCQSEIVNTYTRQAGMSHFDVEYFINGLTNPLTGIITLTSIMTMGDVHVAITSALTPFAISNGITIQVQSYNVTLTDITLDVIIQVPRGITHTDATGAIVQISGDIYVIGTFVCNPIIPKKKKVSKGGGMPICFNPNIFPNGICPDTINNYGKIIYRIPNTCCYSFYPQTIK